MVIAMDDTEGNVRETLRTSQVKEDKQAGERQKLFLLNWMANSPRAWADRLASVMSM
jgi:hypothetical protein